MAGERTTAEAGDREVEVRNSHLDPRIGVGDAHAAGVVEMQRQLDLETAPHRADHASDRLRGGHAMVSARLR